MRAAVVMAMLFLAPISIAAAHEVRPAYLELLQTSPNRYDVTWKVPARGDDARLALYLRLPDDVHQLTPARGRFASGAYVERSSVEREGGLAGTEIYVDGLRATQTDVLVRVQNLDGTTQTTRVTPADPSFVVDAAPTASQVVHTYLRLGVEHILLGVDHLLFVLALLILVKGWRRVVGTITAFTAAHTLTLAAATLGYVHVPVPPVEATIALSIVFVAAEIVHGRRGRPGLTERAPWFVAFGFGLLHGLGFASALNEVGLPQTAIPLALLCFNVGVEIGQVLFVVAVATSWSLGKVVLARWASAEFARRSVAALEISAAYAIGGVASYWVIDRSLAFWS
jgi:hydrogenase/urease accessory protein HupE